jgi:hypothetical protein
VGTGFRVHWLEGKKDLNRMARLLFRNGGVRLALPEAYETHKRIIEWNSKKSMDRIPDHATGLDPMTLHLMRWALASWKRVDFLNRYLGGSLIPRIELDWLPARNCAAHFVIIADNPPEEMDDYIAAGRAVQRFWLTATQCGAFLQPEVTPLVFNEYINNSVSFTQTPALIKDVEKVSASLQALIGNENLAKTVFMGRIGYGDQPQSRSIRFPLKKLIK